MSGTRPLTKEEIALTRTLFKSLRDESLYVLGIKAGFRVTELLSLRLSDIFQHGSIVARVKVERKSMKGKVRSRDVALHSDAKSILLQYIKTELISVFGKEILKDKFFPLFPSRQKDKYGKIVAIKRCQAWNILKAAYNEAEMTGHLATHSMRKTFAKNTYKNLDKDLRQLQLALGHADIRTTIEYLPPDQDAIDKAIMGDDEL